MNIADKKGQQCAKLSHSMRTNESLSADQRANKPDSLRIKGLRQLERSQALYRAAGMIASFGRASMYSAGSLAQESCPQRLDVKPFELTVSPKEMGKSLINYAGGIVPRNRWLKHPHCWLKRSAVLMHCFKLMFNT